MSIIHALIARGSDVILIEQSTASGNFQIIARTLIKKLLQDTKNSYEYNSQYTFHYVNERGFTFLTMTESTCKKQIAYNFLFDLKEKFFTDVNERTRNNGIAFSLSSTPFADYLNERMGFYSNPTNDKIYQVQAKTDELKGIMVENISKLLDRSEQLEMLVKKTEQMNIQSYTMKKQAQQIKKGFWWKNMKTKILIAFIVIIVLYLIIALACGFNLSCSSN